MGDFQTVILFMLLRAFSPVVGITVSGNNCGDVCTAVSGSLYTLTCNWSGSLTTGIIWRRDGITVLTCDAVGTVCVSTVAGYSNGTYPTSTSATVTIIAYNSTVDSGMWECGDGADPTVSCILPNVATGNLQGQCNKNGSGYILSCSGITHGLPQATLKLKDSSGVLASTTTAGFVNVTRTDAGGKQFTCEVTGIAASCMSNTTADFACDQETPSTPAEACRCLCHCDRKTRDIVLLIIEIIILVVILVFLVFNILIGKQVIKCNSKKGAQEHANSKKGAQEHANKISVIICILILVVAAIYGIICVAVTQTEPTIQNAAEVSGQECCCSTCDDNGGDEKKRCEDIATTVLAFGIILIFGAVVLIIAVLILTKIKGLPWMNNFLVICGCGSSVSGHEYIVRDEKNGEYFLASHLIKAHLLSNSVDENQRKKMMAKIDGMGKDEIQSTLRTYQIKSPFKGNMLSDPIVLNLMFPKGNDVGGGLRRTPDEVDGFQTFIVRDLDTNDFFRADHLIEVYLEKQLKERPNENQQIRNILSKIHGMGENEIKSALKTYNIKSPNEGSDLSDPIVLNLMFTKSGERTRSSSSVQLERL